MEEKKLAEAVAKGVKAALGEIKIDCKTHFRHHEVIADWLRWTENIKKTFWAGLVLGFLGFFYLIIRLGFEAYLKLKGTGVG